MKRVLIIGFGSIAQKHIKALENLNSEIEIAILRNASTEQVQSYKTFISSEAALSWSPEAVFISSPATYHIDQATEFAEQGSHLYIEKPLSIDFKGLEKLKSIVAKKSLLVKVGYNLRHHAGLHKLKKMLNENVLGDIYSIRAEVGQWLKDWRPGKDYSKSVTARKELGGGAVLELSHEVDYLRFLFNDIDSVFASVSKKSDMDINVEDNVEAILNFTNGLQASLHLDLLRRDKSRTCTVIGQKGTITLDFIQSTISHYCADENQHKEEIIVIEDTYLKSHEDFFESIRKKQASYISLEDGERTLAVCLAMSKSSLEEKLLKVCE